MDMLEQQLSDILKKLTDMAAQYTPSAWQALLAIVRYDALAKWSFAFAWLVVYIVLAGWLGGYLRRYWLEMGVRRKKLLEEGRESRADDELTGPVMCGTAAAIASAIWLSSVFSTLFNVWVYVAMFRPEYALAKQVFDAVLRKAGGK